MISLHQHYNVEGESSHGVKLANTLEIKTNKIIMSEPALTK